MFSEATDKMVSQALNRQEEILVAKNAADAAQTASKADPRDQAKKDALRSAREVLKQKEKGYDRECKEVLKQIEEELDPKHRER